MRKGYISALALAAAVILIAGSLVRPKPPQQSAAAPPSIAPVPNRRGQMRQISDYLAERSSDSARHVVYLASSQTSGIFWPPERIVTVAPGSAIVGTTSVTGPAPPDPAVFAPDSRFSQAGWIVVVARNSGNEPLTTSGLLGGVSDVNCGTAQVRKLVFNTPLDATFAGGGVFDLSGDLMGIVVRCGENWTAITHRSVEELLGRQQGADAVAWHDPGLRVGAASAEERRLMKLAPGGLFVQETRKGSRAFTIGIRPGDLLVSSGPNVIDSVDDLRNLGDQLTLIREGRRLTLSVNPAYTLDTSAATPVLTSVQSDTKLFAAGLRSGDRIVRASGFESPAPAELNRLLAGPTPVWLVYERDDRRIWTMLP